MSLLIKADITKLSELSIDVSKNWAAKKIENLGAPDSDDDAPRARAGDILSGRFGKPRLEWTLNKLLKGAGAGADPTEIDVPTGGATLTVAETEVFSGQAPTTWTELDLSGTVGSKATLVLLKIYNSDPLGGTAVRKKGDTDEFYFDPVSIAYGCALGDHIDAIHLVLLVVTDTAGKIEWKCNTGVLNTTVDIIAYLN